MADKLLPGCATPTIDAEREYFQNIARAFAPVVFFDPDERFFPVDLPGTIAGSALHRITQTGSELITELGRVTAADLPPAGRDSFTTVLGPDALAAPEIPLDDIAQKYQDGTVSSQLTMYATICIAGQVPNYPFVRDHPPTFGRINEGGLILSYTLYFPAAESPELSREGDWAGMSIYFSRPPSITGWDAELTTGQSALLCYFQKVGQEFSSGSTGLKRWPPSMTFVDQDTGQHTHPGLFVSKGRHNCYDQPVDTTVSVPTLWWPNPEPETVENGEYQPGPTNTVGDDSGAGLAIGLAVPIVGPLVYFLVALCSGDLGFDTSGVEQPLPPTPPGRDAHDSARSGGHTGHSAGTGTGLPTGYPQPGGPLEIGLDTVYVDLRDQAASDAWAYPGSWGSQAVAHYTDTQNGSNTPENYERFGQDYRPNLAPWFLWNLYFDPTLGSSGAGFTTTEGS